MVLFAKDYLLRRIVQKNRGQNMTTSAAPNSSFNSMQHMLYPHLSSTHVQTQHASSGVAVYFFSANFPAERFLTASKSLGMAIVFDILTTKTGIRPPGFVISV